MQQQTVAEISLPNLRANYRALSELAGDAQVIAPVKADAYGHGAVTVAACLAREGVRMFAVVTLAEALELREAGITQDILVMGVVDPRRAGIAAAQDLAVALHSMEHAAECEAAARETERVLRCHVKADTGMGRLGIPWEEAADLAGTVRRSEWLQLDGLMTHMSHAEEPDLGMVASQLDAFRTVIAALAGRDLRPPMVHAANSATLIRCSDATFDAVRPGLALYGVSPCPAFTGHVSLRPVMTWRTAIALVKSVGPGEGVSYCHTWHAEVPSRVAALPVGYADGYCRAFSNRAVVRIGGRLAPVVGNVCMDTTLVDVTDIPSARVGTAATLMEADGESPLSARALADLVGTIPHEIMTGIGRRVRREVVDP